jgi:RNA 3'-terminal phosphate cyclase
MIVLDADAVSGGGSFLRTALVLSVVLQKPVRITNFSLEKKFQGLSADNVALIHSLASATEAVVAGDEVGSTSFSFAPSVPWQPKKISLGLQGSIALALQGLLIPALFSRKQVRLLLTGKTHRTRAPTPSYLQNVFFKYLHPLLETISLKTTAFGFKSGGCVEVTIQGKVHRLPPVQVLGDESLAAIKAEIIATKDFIPLDIVSYLEQVTSLTIPHIHITTRYVDADTSGISLGVFAFYGTEYGFDNDKPFVIGKDATWTSSPTSSFDKDAFTKEYVALLHQFQNSLKQPAVDAFCADQLIALLALVGGTIRVQSVSERTRANIFAAEQISGTRFEIHGEIIQATPRLEEL